LFAIRPIEILLDAGIKQLMLSFSHPHKTLAFWNRPAYQSTEHQEWFSSLLNLATDVETCGAVSVTTLDARKAIPKRISARLPFAGGPFHFLPDPLLFSPISKSASLVHVCRWEREQDMTEKFKGTGTGRVIWEGTAKPDDPVFKEGWSIHIGPPSGQRRPDAPPRKNDEVIDAGETL
jgi:hypothetical protein